MTRDRRTRTAARGAGVAGAREDKRTAILSAAQRLISSNGFDTTSMDAIARCADVSKATVYAYFGSKEALFKMALDDMVRAMPDLGKSMPGLHGSLHARLTSVAHAVLEICADPAMKGFHRMLVRSEQLFLGGPDMYWDLCFERYDKAMQEFLNTEVIRGTLAIPDVASASSQFFGLIAGGPILRALLTGEAFSPGRSLFAYVGCTVELFIRGYQPGHGV
ncbi:TetR/AcrR family transcriptional regulator [Pseudoxanthomonas wuyuanensis]